MESVAEVEGGAVPPHPIPEVIVISDDDESADNREVPNTNGLESFSWTDVADRLLMLAKNRELRYDQQTVETLLEDLDIPPSIEVRRSLRSASEKLGELLMHLHGHDRRYRSCEDLAMVTCEVLSLAQTAPCQTQAKQEQQIKQEGTLVAGNNYAIDQLYQLMDHWQSLVVELGHSGGNREIAVGATMSRLEMLSAHCTRQINHLQKAMVDHDDEKQSAAEEFVAIMEKCRAEIERRHYEAEELEWRVFEDTYSVTSEIQSSYFDSCKAKMALEHRALELELRRNFYQAALKLVCAATQLVAVHDEDELQERTTGERINALGSVMLGHLDIFCETLKAVMVHSPLGQGGTAQQADSMGNKEQNQRPELLHFARSLEQFWLIYRNWLPSMLLEVVIERFDTLVKSNDHTHCPVANAVSRVCAGLRAGFSN